MNYTYIVVVAIMIVFDVLTGLIKAIKNGEVKSSIMRKGLLAKVSEMLILILMYALEYYLPQININLGLPIVQMVAVYIIAMELGSVIENVGAVNEPLQHKLANIFADFIKKEDEDNAG